MGFPMDYSMQGSFVDPELDSMARELSRRWVEKENNPELTVSYYYPADSDWIVFVVYSDVYSGVVKSVANIPAKLMYEDELDVDYVMGQFQKPSRSNTKRIKQFMDRELDSAKRDYGGAYDVDPEEFFTKDDIVEFANEVCEDLTYNTPFEVDLNDVYIDRVDGFDVLHVEVLIDGDYVAEASASIDMRRIRKPSDINKYKNNILVDLIGDINEYFNIQYGESDMNSSRNSEQNGSTPDIKYVQAAIYDDCTPVSDLFSGSGGRSSVYIWENNIDTWNTPEEAAAEGKESFREGAHWGVFEVNMNTRKLIRCVYDSNEGEVSVACARKVPTKASLDDVDERVTSYPSNKNLVAVRASKLDSKGKETTKTLSKEEKDTIKSLFERYGVPIEYTNNATESDEGIEYREYVIGVHNPSRKGYDRLMRALSNLEDEYDIGYWNDYHDEKGEIRDDIHFFHYPEEKLQSSRSVGSKRKTSINCASSRVRNSVEVHVENQIENALEELMGSGISAQATAQEVADYDADWCAEDYPNDIASRIDKAMEELIQASVDLLMYNAPSELKK